MKLLLEMRPALDGHAGIPQETRLLFRELSALPGFEVEGLLLTGNRHLARGFRSDSDESDPDRRIDRLSRVVVSMQPVERSDALTRWRNSIVVSLQPLASVLGIPQRLTRFDATAFRDFIWRAMFERTLVSDDFDRVTAAQFRIARIPWSAMHALGVLTSKFGRALYRRLDTRSFSVLVAETPFPGRVSPSTRLVVRYHDAIPMLMPHTIINRAFHQASHYQALRRNVRDGAWFACVSDATRNDLLSIFPDAAPRAVTIHNMISAHYFAADTPATRIPEILRIRASSSLVDTLAATPKRPSPSPDYLLVVSTIEPRKNHLSLISAWEYLRANGFPHLRLVFVGSPGWDQGPVADRARPWVARGLLHHLENVPAPELRQLYRHARATVCPSLQEGFDFSGVEAMRCGGAVAASDIPVHREVFGEACELFNPYSSIDAAEAIRRVIAPEAASRRDDLVALGAEVSARYLPERILPQWQAFLNGLVDTA